MLSLFHKTQRHQRKYFESSDFATFSQILFAHSCYAVSGCECRLLVVVLQNCAKGRRSLDDVYSVRRCDVSTQYLCWNTEGSPNYFFFTFHFTSGIARKVWQREHNNSINSSQFTAACGNIKLKDFHYEDIRSFAWNLQLRKANHKTSPVTANEPRNLYSRERSENIFSQSDSRHSCLGR